MATQQRQDDDRAREARTGAYDVVLGPADLLPDRPFTDPEHTAGDALVMAMMLARQREVARTWTPDVEGPGISESLTADGRYLLAVPDGRTLLTARDVTAVGFFGQLREGVDHAILFEHERRIAQTFPAFAPLGFLSYFDVGPEHGRYGNLILFWTPDVPVEWHAGPVHRQAVRAAPAHYDFIRLHKGRIPGPLVGRGALELARTQYLDFAAPRPWRALRTYE
jgi:hypothetical protein